MQVWQEHHNKSHASSFMQIHMNEASMPKTVLSIATTRLAREMLRRDDCYEGGPFGQNTSS